MQNYMVQSCVLWWEFVLTNKDLRYKPWLYLEAWCLSMQCHQRDLNIWLLPLFLISNTFEGNNVNNVGVKIASIIYLYTHKPSVIYLYTNNPVTGYF